MKNQKSRSRSANKNRKDTIPSANKTNNQFHQTRDRITHTLKEFKSKSSSNSKRKQKHEKHHSLSFCSNTINSDLDTTNEHPSLRQLIANAKNLMGTQSALLDKCGEMTKLISNTDLELDAIYSQTLINNDQFTHTLNQFKNKIEVDVNEKNSKLMEENDQFKSMILDELNLLNELIGKMGYNYVFHKFKTHNFNSANISEYFSNTKKLLVALNKREHEANDQILHQQWELNNQKEMIAKYQSDLMQFNKSPVVNKTSMNTFSIHREEEDSQIISRSNLIENKDSKINCNTNIVSSSNLFDSNSFFEGYKRNKELRNDLVLDHNYTEMNISQSTVKGLEKNSMNDFDFSK